jgi:hypothetical protein
MRTQRRLTRDSRKNTRIDHPQARSTSDPEVSVKHSHLVAILTNSSRARRMMAPRRITDPRLELCIRLHSRSRREFRQCGIRALGIQRQDRFSEFHAFGYGTEVVGAVCGWRGGGEVVEGYVWRVERVGGEEGDAAGAVLGVRLDWMC